MLFWLFAPSDSRFSNSHISAKYCPILTNVMYKWCINLNFKKLTLMTGFGPVSQINNWSEKNGMNQLSNLKYLKYLFIILMSLPLSLDLHQQTVQDWATCRRSSASRRASSTPCGSTCCPTTPTTPYSFPSCCRNWPTCGSWWRSTRSWSRRSTRRRTLHSTRFCRRSTGTCTDFETSPFSAYSRDPSECGTGDKEKRRKEARWEHLYGAHLLSDRALPGHYRVKPV